MPETAGSIQSRTSRSGTDSRQAQLRLVAAHHRLDVIALGFEIVAQGSTQSGSSSSTNHDLRREHRLLGTAAQRVSDSARRPRGEPIGMRAGRRGWKSRFRSRLMGGQGSRFRFTCTITRGAECALAG